MESIVEQAEAFPNPQFGRPQWEDLTGTWAFAFDDDNVGLRERWFEDSSPLDRTIAVPFPPESEFSGIGETGFHRVFWYARTFRPDNLLSGERLLLTFGAVDYQATVWIDGQYVGEHEGGHTPFQCDITDAIIPERTESTIVVRVVDNPHDLSQPRGKQDWQEQPHSIFYHRTSGIWQPVWLERAPRVRIGSFRWTFDASEWLLHYDVELTEAAMAGTTLEVRLDHPEMSLPSTSVSFTGREVSGVIPLRTDPGSVDRRRLLWSPEQPNLLGAELTLRSPSQPDDRVLTYLGLRTLDYSGERFRINGRDTFLRLVLSQGYWPESHLAAPSADAIRREVKLALELGFNGARVHQKVEDPRFLYWADRLGLLVWGEMANAYGYTERGIDRHMREWRDVVKRDRNHPSVIAWVPFNESWGVDDVGSSERQQQAVHAAYHTTKQLDSTRPVVGNDGWEHVTGDLLTIHDYSWDPEALRSRYSDRAGFERALATYFPGSRRIAVAGYQPAGKPIVLSEYGGVSYAPAQDEEWFGYGTVRSEEEFIAQYEALTSVLHESQVLTGFCYTQLTDTLQETNGLLTADREPKAAIRELRRITRGEDG